MAHQPHGGHSFSSVETFEVPVREVSAGVVKRDFAKGCQRTIEILVGADLLGSGSALKRVDGSIGTNEWPRHRNGGNEAECSEQRRDKPAELPDHATCVPERSATGSALAALRVGQAATRPPNTISKPDIQSHITSGLMKTERSAGSPGRIWFSTA